MQNKEANVSSRAARTARDPFRLERSALGRTGSIALCGDREDTTTTKGDFSMNRMRTCVAVLELVMSAALADAQTKIKAGFNLFSPQQDVEVGQQSAAAADQQL